MSEAGGPREIVHLGWRANGDGFDTALAVNRLRSSGARAWWLQTSHAPADAGDYLVEASLARGALEDANLLILPGGFATWGIDAAEGVQGADKGVRDFLAHGGAAIGSCGGAFYLSAGRPGWTGTVPAKPLYTHEYLQSGVGIVAIALRPGPLGLGCPPTMDVPYYHGPIYDRLAEGIDVAATFDALALPGRLAI